MKKIILISLISLLSSFGFAQTVTNNFEDGNWNHYYDLCWGIGPNDNYFGTKVVSSGQRFNDTDIAETAQLKGNSSTCRLESPWVNMINGNITFDHIMYDRDEDETVTLKVIAISFDDNTETELFTHNYLNENVISTSFVTNLSGIYKIQWKWNGETKKARGQMDNIVIPGNNVSNPSNNCLPLVMVGPDAIDDNASTLLDTPVDIPVLNNDVAGSAGLNPATITFVAGTEPDPATKGTFSVDTSTGLVTFTPVTGFLGIATIDYRVCDLNSLCDIATITVNVIAGTDNFYPAAGPGTLAFEDLWPGKGDYDFNDMVIDYQFEIISNTSNFVEQVTATFVLKAFGASFENGFGFQLSAAINPTDLTVTGHGLTDNIITNESNGTEAGQSKPTIIVFDNAFAHMPNPGIGIGVNTTPEAPYVQPVTFTINIQFKANTYSINALDIAGFNPFIIVNKNRSHEVHLPYYPPTDLADASMFGQWEDDSEPTSGRYYVSDKNLPWAINIYESFDYPIEKQDIISVHLKFAEWAMSDGTLFPDWYKNLSGYRNQSLIYQVPTE